MHGWKQESNGHTAVSQSDYATSYKDRQAKKTLLNLVVKYAAASELDLQVVSRC
jgi:hypothetical protein